MNSGPEQPNKPALPMTNRTPRAASPLEPVIADACQRALQPDVPFAFLVEFCRSIVGLARELRYERADKGQSHLLPLALTEQIEATRDVLARHAADPARPEAMAARLRTLVANLTKTADRFRPSAPIVITHPASISKWLH